MTTPLKVWREAEGRLLRLRLKRPKANLIDAEMIGALDRAFAEHVGNAHIAALLLDADGPHFSFGASVEEHLPDQCAAMLAGLHGRRSNAEGVIFACPSFCDPALLDRPMLQHVLAEAGIPYIAFKYVENSGQMQPIREQAGTFADSIKLWSGQ